MESSAKTPGETQGATQPKGYGKRPLWQWLLVYLVLGLIVYGAIYYYFVSRKGYTSGDTQSGNSEVTYPPLKY